MLRDLGDPGARALLGPEPPPEEPGEWPLARALGRTELAEGRRVALLVAEAALPAIEGERPRCATCGHYGWVQVRFAETFQWDPCPRCGKCEACWGDRRARPLSAPPRPCPGCVELRPRRALEVAAAHLAPPRPDEAGRAALEAAHAALMALDGEPWPPAALAAAEACRAACLAGLVSDPLTLWESALRAAARAVGRERAHARARAGLLAWLVG